MCEFIQADSLAFISIDGLYEALGDTRDAAAPQRCDACFTGDYPTTLTDCDPGAADGAPDATAQQPQLVAG
jgi:amidophosphoribosyltransferase